MASDEQALQQAIAAIAPSDPVVKLLQQVKVGRMKPTDPGLAAVTQSWLATYRKAVATEGLTKQALRRIDPAPRLAVLIEAGIVTATHPSVTSLIADFNQALAQTND